MAIAEPLTVPSNHLQLADFWEMAPAQQKPALLEATAQAHASHYGRNLAYQRLVESRGVGPQLNGCNLARVLRPTARTFRSYISVIGAPFPQNRPAAFLEWLSDEFAEPWTQIYETHQLIGQALPAGTRDS